MSPIRPLWHASLDFLRVPDPPRLPEPPRSTAYTARTYAVEMTARLRPELAELPAYVRGKTVPGAIKLASNETVFGPLPSVRAAIERATDRRQPLPGQRLRRAQISVGQAPELRPSRQSRRVGTRAHRRRLRIGEPVPATHPDQRLGRRRGAVRLAQLRDLPAAGPPRRRHHRSRSRSPIETFDLLAMLAAVTDRTRLIFVCNPNNPPRRWSIRTRWPGSSSRCRRTS